MRLLGVADGVFASLLIVENKSSLRAVKEPCSHRLLIATNGEPFDTGNAIACRLVFRRTGSCLVTLHTAIFRGTGNANDMYIVVLDGFAARTPAKVLNRCHDAGGYVVFLEHDVYLCCVTALSQ